MIGRISKSPINPIHAYNYVFKYDDGTSITSLVIPASA